MNEEEAHEFYKDPQNLEPVGVAQRRGRRAMGGMVPVRFSDEMIASVKRLADLDGMTVSSWIRRLVSREIERRQTPETKAEFAPTFAVVFEPSPSFGPSTATYSDTGELIS